MGLVFEYPDARCITDSRGFVYWNGWKWVEYESKTDGEYISEDSIINTLINPCKDLFNGTYTYEETIIKPDGSSEVVTKNYPSIDLILSEYFLDNYGDKYFKFPAQRCGYDDNYNLRLMQTANKRAQMLMTNYAYSNKYKVLTLLRTIDFKYNPIENYNMVERYNGNSGGDGSSSSSSWLGKVDHKTTGSIVEGPETANSEEEVTTQSSTYESETLRDVSKEIRKPINMKTDYGSGLTVTDEQDETNKTQADSSTSYNDTTSHTLIRSGNIGVTTSQQMIESERKLAQFNVVKDFFDGFEKVATLDIWY